MQDRTLLKNPNPKYYMPRGAVCWVGTDNAHGGENIMGYIDSKSSFDGRDGYVFKYQAPGNPGIELTWNVPAENLFPDFNSLEQARFLDRSVQQAAVRNACSTVKGLVAFLLSRAGLPETEKSVVLEQIRDLGLAGTEDGQKGDGENA